MEKNENTSDEAIIFYRNILGGIKKNDCTTALLAVRIEMLNQAFELLSFEDIKEIKEQTIIYNIIKISNAIGSRFEEDYSKEIGKGIYEVGSNELVQNAINYLISHIEQLITIQKGVKNTSSILGDTLQSIKDVMNYSAAVEEARKNFSKETENTRGKIIIDLSILKEAEIKPWNKN